MRAALFLVAIGLMAPFAAQADSFSFKISIGSGHGPCGSHYCSHEEPFEVRREHRWHRLPCGRRVKQVRAVYYDCHHSDWIHGPWEIKFKGHWCNRCEIKFGCHSGCHHNHCYRHGKRVFVKKSWNPHRSRHHYERRHESRGAPSCEVRRSSAPVIEKRIVKTVVKTPHLSKRRHESRKSRGTHERKYKSKKRSKRHWKQEHSDRHENREIRRGRGRRSVDLAEMGTPARSSGYGRKVVKR